jgi:Sjogren's syndrome/scleroderma autoantigen 1 (Autoantigen p27)
MLKGYVLTDEACPVCSIPMLRSPSGQSPERLFCIQSHATPDDGTSIVRKNSTCSRLLATYAGPTPFSVSRDAHAPRTTSASSEEFSRVSTPPTEVSDALSSPTFAPPPNPQEIMHRRAQSDMASAEIGKRMLRGWAMLAEECPNESCYGVPLVRPPKAGGGKDPRKVSLYSVYFATLRTRVRQECVICSRVYIYQQDAYGLDRLVPLQVTDIASTSTPSQNMRTLIGTTTPTTSTVPRAPARSEVNMGFDFDRYSRHL